MRPGWTTVYSVCVRWHILTLMRDVRPLQNLFIFITHIVIKVYIEPMSMDCTEDTKLNEIVQFVDERVDEIMKIMQDPTLSKKEKLDELTLYSEEDVVEAKRLLKRK